MADDGMNQFNREHLERWWGTTRRYLFADMESQPEGPAEAEDGWLPPETESHGGRKRYLARVRGRLMRSIGCDGRDYPLEELRLAFQRQIAFVARHPDVPRRLLSWLAQDGDPGLQRRVRRLIGHYADRLARIIARAKQQGCVRADIDPHAAAISLVGLIQGLVLKTDAVPRQRERFLRDASEAFTLYRAAIACRRLPRMKPAM